MDVDMRIGHLACANFAHPFEINASAKCFTVEAIRIATSKYFACERHQIAEYLPFFYDKMLKWHARAAVDAH